MRIHGEGIKGLIPQRDPMIMVDEFESEDNSMAQTIINVRPDNMFVSQTGKMLVSGVIEHMKQSVLALSAWNNGRLRTTPYIGYLCEVDNFVCRSQPKTGDRIETTVGIRFSLGNSIHAHAISSIDDSFCTIPLHFSKSSVPVSFSFFVNGGGNLHLRGHRQGCWCQTNPMRE